MKVLIVGDSHTGVLRRGHEALLAAGEWPQGIDLTIVPLGTGQVMTSPFFVDRGDHAEICDSKFRKRMPRLPLANADEPVMLGFSGLFHSARVWRHPDWTRFAPQSLAGDEAPVSAGMLHRIIMEDQKYPLQLIDLLLRNRQRVFAIEAPRPFKHHRALGRIRSEVVRGVDAFYRSAVAKELRQRDVPVVGIRPEWCDEDGFMLERFRSDRVNDMHHGNEEFGRLMVQEILSFLLRSESGPVEQCA